MDNRNKKGFSSCEEELISLTHEIEWALKKRRQDSESEISILKAALSEYKKKYDNCRVKLKDLLRKHEDLKRQYANLDQSHQAQFVDLQKEHEELKQQYANLDQTYRAQLADLQNEVRDLKSSFQILWSDKQTSLEKQASVDDERNCARIVELESELEEYSQLVDELKQRESRNQSFLAQIQDMKEELAEKGTKAKYFDGLAAIAEKAQEKFLQEESQLQEQFKSSVTAKLQCLLEHMDIS